MTARADAGLGRHGRRGARREVADLPEPRAPDRRLDQLLHVRKQRLGRLERERNEARQAWREQRHGQRALKQRWRDAREQAQAQWMAARAAFSGMSITSGEFRKARAVYERMKKEASQLRVDCQQALQACRAAGTDFFEARRRVMQADRQQEKLGVLRDELRAAEAARNVEA
ncbi:MAG: hypothetical protein E2576_02575 [Alcaligenaceae bacterium]|nr:hypothetical protein [Alcaligenaceae bacterium SAGV5]MPS54991.1 hypothetical protein [Alcaligenaceae bacterium SAGV3]MPT55585.1 hypothetical protein [Alcaligenaceae bacterium]